MKKLLGIIAVGAIAFGAVSVAATSLSLGGASAPAQGSVTVSGTCTAASSATTLAYAGAGAGTEFTSGSTVTGFEVSGITCATAPTGVALTGPEAGTATFDSGASKIVVTFTTPPLVSAFSAGSYVVTAY